MKESELKDIIKQSDDTNNRIESIRAQSEDLAMSVARDTLSYAVSPTRFLIWTS